MQRARHLRATSNTAATIVALLACALVLAPLSGCTRELPRLDAAERASSHFAREARSTDHFEGSGESPKRPAGETDSSEPGHAPRAMFDPATGLAASAAVNWGPRLTRAALLYYIPNLLLDFFDIIRFDIGFGISYGVVGRFTKWGQLGARGFSPSSVRFGLHGRYHPVFVERSAEYGIGPTFVNNLPRARSLTPVEVGLNVDLLPVGAYAGISFDELLDFLLGIIFIDFKDDSINFQ